MKPEYEKICSDIDTELASERLSLSARAAVRMAVTKCEALAAKPRKLTVHELNELEYVYSNGQTMYGVVAKLDEIRARPPEPETVPFDYEKWSKGGWQAIDPTGYHLFLKYRSTNRKY